MLRKNKGITIIALVVTIIILLILAGVTIGVATNNSGLFEKAKIAAEKYNNAAADEEKTISQYNNDINSYISGNREVNLSDEVKNYIDSKLDKSAITLSQSGTQALTTTVTKYSLTTVEEQKGTKLTLDNGGVKIGAGVNYVLVAARHYLGGSDQSCGDSYIYLNDTMKFWSTSRMSGASDQMFDMTPQLVSVSEGDHIYFYAARGSVSSSIKAITLTVIEL